MTDQAAPKPCCFVAKRPDAADIDAALRAGGEENSVRAVAKRFGLGKTPISNHRGHLGLRTAATPPGDGQARHQGTGPTAAQPAPAEPAQATANPGHDQPAPPSTSPAATQQDAAEPASGAWQPEQQPKEGAGGTDEGTAGNEVAEQQAITVTSAHPLPRARALGANADPGHEVVHDVGKEATGMVGGAAPPVPPPPPAAVPVSPPPSGDADALFRERVMLVANIVAVGKWRGWATVLTLSSQWRCTHEEVYRLHRAAARMLKRARGGLLEQLESSVAVTQRIKTADEECAAEYDKEAMEIQRKLKKEPDWTKQQMLVRAATSARKAALEYRSHALDAQKQLDAITLKRELEVRVLVEFSGDPRFQAGFDLVSRIVEELFPGGAALLDEGVATYEGGGEAALVGWLEQKKTDIFALPAHAEESGQGG